MACFDEETKGKLRTQQKLTPPNLPPQPRWDMCDVPCTLLAALKLRTGKARSKLVYITILQDRCLPPLTGVLAIYRNKACLATPQLPEGNVDPRKCPYDLRPTAH